VFRRWATGVPTDVELVAVQLPGRETRIAEPLLDELDALVDATIEGIGQVLRSPFAIYGHSMGALVAFELSRRLQREKRPLPDVLFVSGFRAPHLPDDAEPVHGLSDDELVTEMRALAGTPDVVLDDAELRSLLVPILRADFRVCETYVHHPGPALECPVVAIAGIDDAFAATDAMALWSEHTEAGFTLHVLRADHFALIDLCRDIVFDEIASARRAMPGGATSPIGDLS
jgi:medium-chain acyl-[acyl-carrier-protein] hydrolase